jgi:hypothetical protein
MSLPVEQKMWLFTTHNFTGARRFGCPMDVGRSPLCMVSVFFFCWPGPWDNFLRVVGVNVSERGGPFSNVACGHRCTKSVNKNCQRTLLNLFYQKNIRKTIVENVKSWGLVRYCEETRVVCDEA